MSDKRKPILFKSRSKGAVDITIRNPEEFSRFLDSGHFQRQYMLSLLSQVFDPGFIFNPVYQNIAKLINRRIITSHPKVLAMTTKVPSAHFSVLRKLSRLFFETQKLSAPRYALLPNTPLANMKNYLIGFADGSLNFSTSSIYLISCDTTSNRSRTTLINTMSKLVDNTKINQTEASILDKEMHGLWLAASNALKALHTIQEVKIAIEAVYLGCDALSQVVGLSRPHIFSSQK